SELHDLGRSEHGADPPSRHAARPVRGRPRRRRRRPVDAGRLLPGDADPREALRGIQGAARRREPGLSGDDEVTPERSEVIPELGYGAIIVGALLAVYGAGAAVVGARTGRIAVLESAQHAALGVFGLITGALLLLVYAFLTFDFSLRYVAT